MKFYKIKMHYLLFIFLFMVAIPVYAISFPSNSEVKKISKLQDGDIPIPQCNLNEKKEFMKLFRKSKIQDKPDLSIKSDGNIYISNYGGNPANFPPSRIEIYKSNFSNEVGVTEYLLVWRDGTTTIGSISATDIKMYKRIGDNLIEDNLTSMIEKSSVFGKDSSLTYTAANPFAVVNKGKIYLRYISMAPFGSNIKPLSSLHTYILENNKFTLQK